MANVITQVEMMKYRGASTAVFPSGTILTPSAKDWAKEQGITVSFGDAPETGCVACDDKLQTVIAALIRQFRAVGRKLDRDELVAATEEVLRKLNQ